MGLVEDDGYVDDDDEATQPAKGTFRVFSSAESLMMLGQSAYCDGVMDHFHVDIYPH